MCKDYSMPTYIEKKNLIEQRPTRHGEIGEFDGDDSFDRKATPFSIFLINYYFFSYVSFEIKKGW